MGVGGADDDSVTDAEKDVEARKEVASVIRASPDLLSNIGAERGNTDSNLVKALAGLDYPYGALKAAGCDPEVAARTFQLLPYAVRAPADEDRRRRAICTKDRVWGVGLLLALAGIIVGSVFTQALYTQGWQVGDCTIRAFSNRTCSNPDRCELIVQIRATKTIEETKPDGSKEERMEMELHSVSNWRPPVKKDYASNRMVLDGDVFRCCDLSGRLSCCSFYDAGSQAFCDNWPGKVDNDGNACPTGNWKCIFKKAQIDGIEQVTQLKVYSAPPVWPFIVAAVLVIVIAAIRFAMRKHRSEIWRAISSRSTSFYASFHSSRRLATDADFINEGTSSQTSSGPVQPMKELPPMTEEKMKAIQGMRAPTNERAPSKPTSRKASLSISMPSQWKTFQPAKQETNDRKPSHLASTKSPSASRKTSLSQFGGRRKTKQEAVQVKISDADLELYAAQAEFQLDDMYPPHPHVKKKKPPGARQKRPKGVPPPVSAWTADGFPNADMQNTNGSNQAIRAGADAKLPLPFDTLRTLEATRANKDAKTTKKYPRDPLPVGPLQ